MLLGLSAELVLESPKSHEYAGLRETLLSVNPVDDPVNSTILHAPLAAAPPLAGAYYIKSTPLLGSTYSGLPVAEVS